MRRVNPSMLSVMSLVVLAAACSAGGTAQGPADAPSDAGASTGSAAGSATGTSTGASTSPSPTSGTVAVRGQVVLGSDVETIPETPLPRGVVLLVPVRAAASFWTALGLDPAGPPQTAQVAGRVAPAAVPEAVVVPVGPDGSFAGDAPDGPLLVCLADVDPAAAEGPPHAVVGCVQADPEQVGAGLRLVYGRGVRLEP